MAKYIRPYPSKDDQKGSDTIRYIEKFIRDLKPEKALDIGCGDGYLEEKFPDQIYGIDIEEDRIKKLQDSGVKNVQVGSATEIPSPDAAFDMVIAKDLIEHLGLEDVFAMFSEASRVLKSGGYFVITTWRDCQVFWDKVDHVRPYSNKWVQNLCRSGYYDFEIFYKKELSAGIPFFGILGLEKLSNFLADKFRFRVDHGIIVLKKK